MKKRKIELRELRSLEATIEQLESLLAGLRSGALTLAEGDEELSLRPGGAVHFELHAETKGERERVKLVLDWRRKTPRAGSETNELSRSPGTERDATSVRGLYGEEPVTLRTGASGPGSETSAKRQGAPRAEAVLAQEIERQHAAGLASEPPVHPSRPAFDLPHSIRSMGAAAAKKYQELYAAARSAGTDGVARLDASRYAQSLAQAGVDPLTQQELYNLACQADADGRATLFRDDVLAALPEAS